MALGEFACVAGTRALARVVRPVRVSTEMGLPRYWFFVTNRHTRTSFDVIAESAEGACHKYGWMPEDCVVVCVGKLVERAGGIGRAAISGQRPSRGERGVPH